MVSKMALLDRALLSYLAGSNVGHIRRQLGLCLRGSKLFTRTAIYTA